jgi:hypothetical protein
MSLFQKEGNITARGALMKEMKENQAGNIEESKEDRCLTCSWYYYDGRKDREICYNKRCCVNWDEYA